MRNEESTPSDITRVRSQDGTHTARHRTTKPTLPLTYLRSQLAQKPEGLPAREFHTTERRKSRRQWLRSALTPTPLRIGRAPVMVMGLRSRREHRLGQLSRCPSWPSSRWLAPWRRAPDGREPPGTCNARRPSARLRCPDSAPSAETSEDSNGASYQRRTGRWWRRKRWLQRTGERSRTTTAKP